MIYNFRNLFIAPEGKKLIKADFDNQELRVCAHVCQDGAMIRALKMDKDLHLTTANEAFHLDIPEPELYKGHILYSDHRYFKFVEERYLGKNGINFPILYGSTPWGVAARLGKDEEEVKQWFYSFFKLYPQVQKKINETRFRVQNHQPIISMFGRRRRLNYTGNRAFRQAFNFLIQGACADILRIAANNVRSWILNYTSVELLPVLTVHDEMVYETDEEYAEWAAKEIKNIMEESVKISVPLKVSVKIVDRYGE